MINGFCPDYLNELVPETVRNRARYSLRNADNISTIRTNSVLYYESSLPSAIRAWNDLPNAIRNSTSQKPIQTQAIRTKVQTSKPFLLRQKSTTNTACTITYGV